MNSKAPLYYKQWIVGSFIGNIIMGFSSFLSVLNSAFGFAGVPFGIGTIVYPVLILHFLLCLLAWDNTFLKGGFIISIVFSILIGFLAIISLLSCLG